MKAILNWRYWVIAILFSIGLIAIGCSFGEASETKSDSEWLLRVAISFSIGSGSFYALGRCIRYWERERKIPEFTKQ